MPFFFHLCLSVFISGYFLGDEHALVDHSHDLAP